jgi:hypothetical protein
MQFRVFTATHREMLSRRVFQNDILPASFGAGLTGPAIERAARGMVDVETPAMQKLCIRMKFLLHYDIPSRLRTPHRLRLKAEGCPGRPIEPGNVRFS